MLNITGLVKITKFEELSEKSVKATVYFGTKKGKDSEEWENSFFNAILIGSACEKSFEVAEKDPIYITKGLVKNVTYQDKEGKNRSYLSLTIFDFIHGEEEITKKLEELKTGSKPVKQEKPKRERKQKWNSKETKAWYNEENLTLIDDGDIPF